MDAGPALLERVGRGSGCLGLGAAKLVEGVVDALLVVGFPITPSNSPATLAGACLAGGAGEGADLGAGQGRLLVGGRHLSTRATRFGRTACGRTRLGPAGRLARVGMVVATHAYRADLSQRPDLVPVVAPSAAEILPDPPGSLDGPPYPRLELKNGG